MEQRQAVIKNADMSDDMQQDAVDIASQAISKYNIEKVRDLLTLVYWYEWFLVYSDYLLQIILTKDVAAFIKKEFDKKYNPTWHVIVGRNFGSYVTHETKHFIYFYLGQVAVLIFKAGWLYRNFHLLTHYELCVYL